MTTRLTLSLAIAMTVVACSNEAATTSASAPAAPAETQTSEAAAPAKTITATALHQRLQSDDPKPLVVDVREPSEFEGGHIAEAQLVPLGTVEDGLANVPKDKEIVLVCRSGNRSGKAQDRLAQRGYTNLKNMEGGMLAWERAQLPVAK